MLKKYLLSFLSGFLFPLFGILVIFLIPYGAFMVLIYGPWGVLINFVSLFLFKKYFQEKYSFVAGILGFLIPLFALGMYSIIHYNLNAIDPKTINQSVTLQPDNNVSIQTLKCNDLTVNIAKDEKIKCSIYLNNPLLEADVTSYELKMDQLFDYNKDQNQTLESFVAKCIKLNDKDNEINCTFENKPANNVKYELSLIYKSGPRILIQDVYFNY